ncbi:MAG: hypothetical protein NWS80_13380 [Akkermansiaceae bacterium]|nr:hypothetical protein [Akkermansiaceae bacterium]
MFKRYWWMFLVMLPVGAVGGFFMASVVTYVMPKKYESSATIEIKPQRQPTGTWSGSPDAEALGASPQFFGTEFEKIKSRNSLMKVVDTLDLSNKWGMDRESVLQILKGIVTTENIRGTDLISIRVRHTNKEDARDIAAGVARAYKDYRTELKDRVFEKSIMELKRAVREQEDKVEERRKIFVTISRHKGPYLLDGSNLPKSVDGLSQEYLDAQRDFEVEQGLLEKLKLKLISAEIDADIEMDSVIVHDDPVISNSPISPNVRLNLVLGLAGGALLSPFLALPVMWFLNRRSAVS